MRVTFVNQGAHPHTIHFHGWHPPAMDGSLPEHQVQPGGTFEYQFDADPCGLHLYHCHAVPLKRHIHKGLYGHFIVDPRRGATARDDLVMVMNGFDTNFDNENEVYAVNTVARFYMSDPIGHGPAPAYLPREHHRVRPAQQLPPARHVLRGDRTGTSRTPTEAPTRSCCVRASGRFWIPRSGIPATSCSTRTRASSRSSAGWGCSARGASP